MSGRSPSWGCRLAPPSEKARAAARAGVLKKILVGAGLVEFEGRLWVKHDGKRVPLTVNDEEEALIHEVMGDDLHVEV